MRYSIDLNCSDFRPLNGLPYGATLLIVKSLCPCWSGCNFYLFWGCCFFLSVLDIWKNEFHADVFLAFPLYCRDKLNCPVLTKLETTCVSVLDGLGNGWHGVFVRVFLKCRIGNMNSEFVVFWWALFFWYLYIICFVFIPISEFFWKLILAFLQRAWLFLYDLQHLIFCNIVWSVWNYWINTKAMVYTLGFCFIIITLRQKPATSVNLVLVFFSLFVF